MRKLLSIVLIAAAFFTVTACNLQQEEINSSFINKVGDGVSGAVTPFPQNSTGVTWIPSSNNLAKKRLTGQRLEFSPPTIMIDTTSDIRPDVRGQTVFQTIQIGLNNGTIRPESIKENYSYNQNQGRYVRNIYVKQRRAANNDYHGNNDVEYDIVFTEDTSNDHYLLYKTEVLSLPVTNNTLSYDKVYSNKIFNYKITYPRVPDRTQSGDCPAPNNRVAHLTEWGYIAPVVIKDVDEGGSTAYRMWYTKLNARFNNSRSYKNLYTNYTYEYIPKYSFSKEGQISWMEDDNSPLASGLAPLPNSKLNDKGGVVICDVIRTSDTYYLWYIAKDSDSYDFSGFIDKRTTIMGRTWKLFSAYLDDNMLEWRREDSSNLLMTLDTGAAGFDNFSIHKSSLLYDKNELTYKIWYTGYNSSSLNIGRATAINGLTGGYKDKDKAIYKGRLDSFDSREIADPFIMKDGNLYKMWYSGYDGQKWRIGLAYSWDGLNFTYYSDEHHDPLNLLPADHNNPFVNFRFPCVVKADNGNYMMWYSKQNQDGTWQIEMANSQAVVQ